MTRNVFPKVKAVNHSYSLMIDFDLEIVKATEYCYRPFYMTRNFVSSVKAGPFISYGTINSNSELSV